MNAPPHIASITKSTQDSSPVWGFAGMLLLLAVARLSLAWPFPVPFCLLKRLTGIPCPFCGTTRCLQACSQLDFAAALHWNPLAFVACVGIAVWFVAWVVDRLWHRRWLALLRRVPQLRAIKLGLIAAVLLNWVYLWRALR